MVTGYETSPAHARAAARLRRVFSKPSKLLSSWWRNPPAFARYGVAVALVAGAFLAERLMQDYLVGAPALLFICATMLSGWFGGFGPGLVAVALAVLGFGYYLVDWDHSLAVDPRELPRLTLFTVAVILVALLSARQRSITESLKHARDALESSNSELQLTNEALLAENAERERVEQTL